jgi:cell wall-associated NlpC family hydrolase
VTFDTRITPARSDLAASHLRGSVQASRFVEGEMRVIVAAQAPMRHAPSPDAPLDTEALKGEHATIYETTSEGWAWGQLCDDGYVGWLPATALGVPEAAPTHKVAALRTLVFPGPSIKLPPLDALPFGARLTIARIAEPFAVTSAGGYVPLRHLVGAADKEKNFVAVAERFTGAPYLWGGKTSLGLDCSALVQVALTACGVPSPRDSDMQERSVGVPISPASDLSNLRRGDLIFWKGHVAIVRDPATLIHANAFHMAVASEPVAEALTRIRAAGSEPTSVKRISIPSQ